ncbi:MAG: hypothetical protein N4A63_03465 [Vallitalea sp.]|nr:hypothetical protein [Vallitalea sp.]
MMMKKLVALGLGVVLSANLFLPTMAKEIKEDTRAKVESRREVFQKDSRGIMGKNKEGFMGKRAELTKEEHLDRLQKGLEALEDKLENGIIDQEKYNDIKEKMEKAIEAINNGELPKFDKHFKPHKPLSKEEMLEKLQNKLTGLESKFNEGTIDEEKYNTIKEKIETMIEKIENGEKVDFRHFFKKRFKINKDRLLNGNLTNEQIKERLEEKLTRLEKALEEGKIEQDRYDNCKKHIETLLNKVNSDE